MGPDIKLKLQSLPNATANSKPAKWLCGLKALSTDGPRECPHLTPLLLKNTPQNSPDAAMQFPGPYLLLSISAKNYNLYHLC
jgi:hypothetical protein